MNDFTSKSLRLSLVHVLQICYVKKNSTAQNNLTALKKMDALTRNLMVLCLVTFVKGIDINVHTCTYTETLAKISCRAGSGESSPDRSLSRIKKLEIAASGVAVIDTKG